ncbi:nucleoside-diphosphate sugar epimerase/dehydratase [Bacillus sp. Bos-x628]|uniref:polysaccharide biosynthesis protein n=1 Tax=Bacillus maqinnsis TaxID=3229854 RepID=UPI00339007AA
MTYAQRLSMIVALDSYLILVAVFFGFKFVQEIALSVYSFEMLVISSLSLLIGHNLFAHIFHVYKQVWAYTGIRELFSLMKTFIFSFLFSISMLYLFVQTLPFRLLFIIWIFHVLFIGASRMASRLFHDGAKRLQEEKERALIIGAGSAGTIIVRQLQQSNDLHMEPVAFIDDDKTKHKLEIMGLPVLGGKEKIQSSVILLNIQKIIIAIPSKSNHTLTELYKECVATGVKTQIMPEIEQILKGTHALNQLRDVQPEDLLGREPIQLDTSCLSVNLKEKTILVTGAGGSIGSEICRQICVFAPKAIVLVGHGEFSIHSILLELTESYGDSIRLYPQIADIQDQQKMNNIVGHFQPDMIYHAAAHKHVPLMEISPKEAVKNNVIGTKNVAEAAHLHGVETFVLISSDKAVNPANVMGATKRFAEMLIMQMGANSDTKFVAVRFGNVLGSRGSVIPIFKKQIEKGGPVTVTHPAMTRYFMTIPEASRLVIQAGALAKGREIFVLDMGEPVKIVDLAENLIHLSGYTTDQIPIIFTGIRPGEKMHEELLNHHEKAQEQVFPKIHIGHALDGDPYVLNQFIQEFEKLSDEQMRQALFAAIESKDLLSKQMKREEKTHTNEEKSLVLRNG